MTHTILAIVGGMKVKMNLMILLPIIALVGCATMPNGPTVKAMPGQGKTFDQFQSDRKSVV